MIFIPIKNNKRFPYKSKAAHLISYFSVAHLTPNKVNK